MISPKAQGNASAADELAALRAELAKEQAQLSSLEENVGSRAAQLAYLNAEYIANVSRVRQFYEPKLLPLREVTYAAEVQQQLIDLQIKWLERKVALQEKCATENGVFLEKRDMRPLADEMMNRALKELHHAYEEIQNCSPDALRILAGYVNPPDPAMETMFMVQRLRGEATAEGPVPDPDSEPLSKKKTEAEEGEEGSAGAKKTAASSSTGAAAPSAPIGPQNDKLPEVDQAKLLYAAALSWPTATVLASHNYFTNFFVPRSEGMLQNRELLEPELMIALEDFCHRPEHCTAALYECSEPVGCLGRWLHAVRDVYRVRMVTAPVLLKKEENIAAKSVNRIKHTVDLITFGEAEPIQEVESPQAGAADEPTSGDAAKAPSAHDDLLAVTESYHQLQKRLAGPRVETTLEGEARIVKLRHRHRQLDDNCRDARDATANINAEMDEKIREVRANYDDTMLPLHDQLEENTRDFVSLLTGEEAA